MSETTKSVQQSFAKNSGYQNYTIWDKYAQDDLDFLELKLKHLVQDQTFVESEYAAASDEKREKAKKEIMSTNKKLERTRQDIIDSVWAQRKYTNKNLLSSIIYVLVTNETDKRAALKATEFSCHPVFRTRKCILNDGKDNSENSENCCMIFVDENGRVYQNWQAYVDNNVLPAGMMIAPHNGIYTMSGSDEEVDLVVCPTPACSWSSWIAGKADTTSMVGGFAAAAVPLGALAMPIAAPIMLGATVVGLASAGYSALRSGYHLYDRNAHERPIGLDDAQARGSWLGLLGGTVGLGAFGATRVLTNAASTGRTVSTTTKVLVNGMNMSTILISGGGVANGVLDLFVKYNDDDTVEIFDLMQLAASAALFTHSVYNFRMASTIISETQNSTIGALRKNYSRNQRRSFEKAAKETVRINGPERGKSAIIRSANKLDGQAFNNLYKINGILNENNVRPSFSTTGEGIILNNDLHVDTATLRQNLQHKVGPNLLEQVRQPIPPSHGEASAVRQTPATRQLFTSVADMNDFSQGMSVSRIGDTIVRITFQLIDVSGHKILVILSDQIIKHLQNEDTFYDILKSISKNYSEEIINYLLRFTTDYLQTFASAIERSLKTNIGADTVLFRILKVVLGNYKVLSIQRLNGLKKIIIMSLNEYFESLKTITPSTVRRVKCDTCPGFYAIVDL